MFLVATATFRVPAAPELREGGQRFRRTTDSPWRTWRCFPSDQVQRPVTK